MDFLVERERDRLLIEVKDPSMSTAPPAERERFVHKMASRELWTSPIVSEGAWRTKRSSLGCARTSRTASWYRLASSRTRCPAAE
ncbi:hypothetical protein [Haliangium sp.]|uniref:hypothetical protein n=1 Tax=Haliangium sp. TaxID=2663208 RepID=UPI003D0C8D47